MKKLKVLIGDNSMGFGMLCRDNLEKDGVEVIMVPKDGNKVLEAVEESNPDIVVMEMCIRDRAMIVFSRENKNHR